MITLAKLAEPTQLYLSMISGHKIHPILLNKKGETPLFDEPFRVSILWKDLISIRQFVTQRFNNLPLGIQPAWESLFDSGNCDWGNISLSREFSFAHQDSFSNFFEGIFTHQLYPFQSNIEKLR